VKYSCIWPIVGAGERRYMLDDFTSEPGFEHDCEERPLMVFIRSEYQYDKYEGYLSLSEIEALP
jgi:urate oxidase